MRDVLRIHKYGNDKDSEGAGHSKSFYETSKITTFRLTRTVQADSDASRGHKQTLSSISIVSQTIQAVRSVLV